MARKKKTEDTKVTTKKKVSKAIKSEALKHYAKGEIIFIPTSNLPGKVLGRVYPFEADGYEPCNARLVYIGAEQSKLIIE